MARKGSGWAAGGKSVSTPKFIDIYFAAAFKHNYTKLFTGWLMTDQPFPNASQRCILHTRWVGEAVAKTLAATDVSHAFAHLGYTWLGTQPGWAF